MRPLGKAVLQLKARTAGTWDCRGLTVDSGVIFGKNVDEDSTWEFEEIYQYAILHTAHQMS